MASKKQPTRRSKAAFVRSQDRNMAAKDVVAAGKAKGMTVSEQYVYTVRSAAAARAESAPQGAATRKGPPARVSAARMTPAEVKLRDAIADLGILKATEILRSVQMTIRGQ